MSGPGALPADRGWLLAHLSDPHLPLPPGTALHEVINKRVLSLLSWHTKRHRHHRRETLDLLTDDLRTQAPDLIAVTGDLTNLGLGAEYAQARVWLDSLGDAGRVSVIPGNHEALVRGAWPGGAPLWQPFWQGDADPQTDLSRAFPYLRRRGPLALIGLSSAVASPPGQAVGAVGPEQLDRLALLLARARDAGLCRVLMVHHPPLDGTVIARKALRDAAALRAVLDTEGVELVLHGHSHRSHLQEMTTAHGPAPVVGVPSASSMHPERASYNLYRIAPVRGGWEVEMTSRSLTSDNGVETAQRQLLRIARDHAPA